MSESKPQVAAPSSLWKTLSAIANHAVLWFLCLVELVAVPRFIRIYEAFDYMPPSLTIVVINLYSACHSVSIYLLPLLALGLFAADALVLFLLFRIPSLRIVATFWYFAVLLGLLLFAGFIAAGLLLPISALNEQFIERAS